MTTHMMLPSKEPRNPAFPLLKTAGWNQLSNLQGWTSSQIYISQRTPVNHSQIRGAALIVQAVCVPWRFVSIGLQILREIRQDRQLHD